MTPKRLLTLLAAAACLLSLSAPASATDSGGVPYQSFDETGGGIVAPAGEPDAVAASAEVAEDAEAPAAEPAQEETPTTPEGEEQPPEEENGGEQGDDEVVTPPTGGDDGAAGEAGGFLPRTGLELLALTSIGLGLLLAGGALWPTSSWPPPRDRLSRPLPRR